MKFYRTSKQEILVTVTLNDLSEEAKKQWIDYVVEDDLEVEYNSYHDPVVCKEVQDVEPMDRNLVGNAWPFHEDYIEEYENRPKNADWPHVIQSILEEMLEDYEEERIIEDCKLCEIVRGIKGYIDCNICPWNMYEGKSCIGVLPNIESTRLKDIVENEDYGVLDENDGCTEFEYYYTRAIRIKMLKEWIAAWKELNAKRDIAKVVDNRKNRKVALKITSKTKR